MEIWNFVCPKKWETWKNLYPWGVLPGAPWIRHFSLKITKNTHTRARAWMLKSLLHIWPGKKYNSLDIAIEHLDKEHEEVNYWYGCLRCSHRTFKCKAIMIRHILDLHVRSPDREDFGMIAFFAKCLGIIAYYCGHWCCTRYQATSILSGVGGAFFANEIVK